MAISLNTNLNSISAQGKAKRLNEEIQNSTQKLASGSRITKAGDDAASLAISEKYKANIRSSYQANRNANDAISTLQVIEGNLTTVNDLAIQMRELALQASNDTYTNQDIKNSELIFQNYITEIKRITSSTKYDGQLAMSGTSEVLQSQLVDRSPKSFEFKIGGGTSAQENTISFRPSQLSISALDYNISGLTISSKNSAQSSLSEIDKMIHKVGFSRASLGAISNQLKHSINTEEISNENMQSANSKIRDVDYAAETANNLKTHLISESNLRVQNQINTPPNHLLRLIS